MQTYCPRLWNAVQIWEDGSVYTCCHRKPGPLGNIHHSSLAEILNGERLRRYRQQSLDGTLECHRGCTLLQARELEMPRTSTFAEYAELKTLRIVFSESCNIACIMCTQDHESTVSLDFDALARNIDLTPFERIDLLGGEPMFVPAAKRFFEHAAAQRKKVSFLTNGLLITEEWAEKIARHSAFVYFSLNGASKEVHEYVNRGSVWEKVLRNIQRVRTARARAATQLQILGHMTIVTANLDEIPAFIRGFRGFGFDAVGFGFDEMVPHYLAGMSPGRRSALIRETRAAVAECPFPHLIDGHRLELLGLLEQSGREATPVEDWAVRNDPGLVTLKRRSA